jgi:tetratricopeptide (TPR) repeat protein
MKYTLLFSIIFFSFSPCVGQNLEAPTWEDRSFFLVESGEYGKAVLLYDSILKTKSRNAQAHLLKVDALIHLGKNKEALNSLRDIKEGKLDQTYEITWIGLMSRAYLNLRHLDSAITLLNSQIQKNPSQHQLYFYLAQSHYLKKELPKAQTAIIQCIAIYPRHIKAHILFSKITAKIGNRDLAALPLAYALTLSPWQDSSKIFFNKVTQLIRPKLSSSFLANPSTLPDEILKWINYSLDIISKNHKNSVWTKVYSKFLSSLKTNNHQLAYYYFLQQGLKDSARDHWILANTLSMEPFYIWLSSKLPPEEIPTETYVLP